MKRHIGLIVACLMATACGQVPAGQTIDFGPGAVDAPSVVAPADTAPAVTPVDQGTVPAEPAPVAGPDTPIPVEPDFPIGGPVPDGGGGGGSADPGTPVTDNYFLIELRRDQRSGVALADLALTSSDLATVGNLATELRATHLEAAGLLDDVAADIGLALPTGMSDEGLRWSRRIQERETGEVGETFDLAEVYAEAVVELLEKDVAMIRFVANGGTDADVRELAADLLPEFEDALDDARDLASDVGVEVDDDDDEDDDDGDDDDD